MLRRLRFFPACGRKREWPCCQFSDMVLISRRPGDDAWRFRESCPDVLRAGSNPSHVWSEKRARVQWMNAAMPRVRCGRFVRFGRSSGQDKKRGRQKSRNPVCYRATRECARLFRELPPNAVCDAFAALALAYSRSPYSLNETARAASSHLLNASAISFTVVLCVNTNGSIEHRENLSDTDSRSSESS
jgi:hypothetical protein